MTKFESVNQKNLFYWAEPNELDNGETFCVFSQMKGFPATEAFPDWFKYEKDAEEIAKRLANGENLF